MTPLVPIGSVIARMCLAGACLSLLAMGGDSRLGHSGNSPVRAAVAGHAAAAGKVRTQGPSADRHADSPHRPEQRARLASGAAELLPGVHPVGLSSDGDPDDVRQFPLAAHHHRTQQ